MDKAVVIYKSKYGATKKYAEWIASELKADISEASKMTVSELKNYSIIIFGGGLYAGGINGISIITKNFEKMRDKKIIVFTCGFADPKNEDSVKRIRAGIDKIFAPEMKEKITFFHLRGGIDYAKLGVVHKSMMAMMKNMLSKKEADGLTDDDKEMLKTYGTKVEYIDKTSITPIIEYCGSM